MRKCDKEACRKLVTFEMEVEDIERLDRAVGALKARGSKIKTRSALLRWLSNMISEKILTGQEVKQA